MAQRSDIAANRPIHIRHPGARRPTANDVLDRLMRVEPLRRLGMHRMEIAVDASGLVTLRGNVSTESRKEIATKLAQSIRGITRVRNELVPDSQIESEILAGLQAHPETRTGHGPVRSQLGAVTFAGPAPSKEFAALAADIAVTVPGVRVVLDATEAPEPQPLPKHLDLKFGQPVICQGRPVGKLNQLLIDASSWQVQHVLLKEWGVPATWIAVRPEVCASSDAQFVYLNLTERELAGQPRSDHWDVMFPARSGDAYTVRTITGGLPVVHTAEGRVGTLTAVRLEPSGQIGQLGVRVGWPVLETAWVEASSCSLPTNKQVECSHTKRELVALAEQPEPRPDGTIVRDALDRLAYASWHALPAGVLRLRSSRGVVTVSGTLHNPLDHAAVMQLLASIHGVSSVHDEVVVAEPTSMPVVPEALLLRKAA